MVHDSKKSAEQCDQLVAEHMNKAANGQKPSMPTMQDIEAMTRHTEAICHDPRRQSKP